MSGMSLYRMTDEYQRLLDSITDSTDDGVNFDKITESLDQIEGDIRKKTENCAKFYRCMEARREAYERERKLFYAKELASKNAAEKLKEYVKLCMERIGAEKIVGDSLTISLCKNGNPSLNVTGKVPAEYFIPQEPIRNDSAIKKDLLAGKELDFAELNYGKQLRIR